MGSRVCATACWIWIGTTCATSSGTPKTLVEAFYLGRTLLPGGPALPECYIQQICRVMLCWDSLKPIQGARSWRRPRTDSPRHAQYIATPTNNQPSTPPSMVHSPSLPMLSYCCKQGHWCTCHTIAVVLQLWWWLWVCTSLCMLRLCSRALTLCTARSWSSKGRQNVNKVVRRRKFNAHMYCTLYVLKIKIVRTVIFAPYDHLFQSTYQMAVLWFLNENANP